MTGWSNQYTHWYVDPKDNQVKPVYESAFALKPELQGSITNLQEQENDLAQIKKLQGMYRKIFPWSYDKCFLRCGRFFVKKIFRTIY
mgnify:CR=1 FL=1